MNRTRAILAAGVLLAATSPVSSQVLNRPTLYRLKPTSTLTRGCFPPCLCPVQESGPITGTFVLSLVSVGDVYDFYDVTGVRLKFKRSNTEVVEITGSGTYAVSTVADLQRMELTLVVGTEPPTLYRSDDVPGGAAFPLIALSISINGGVCHDTVIALRARPARRLHVESNALHWDLDPDDPQAPSDVVFGDLRSLRQTGGGFDVATWGCVVDACASGSTSFTGVPAPSQGYWFLERDEGGLYEDGDAAQVGTPDPGIARSAGACP